MGKRGKKIAILLLSIMCCITTCLGLVACNDVAEKTPTGNIQNIVDSGVRCTEPQGKYNAGVVLVKSDGNVTKDMMKGIDVKSVTPLYNGAKWYSVVLSDESKTEEAFNKLSALDLFEKVDYDYVMGSDSEIESIDVSCNPDYSKQKEHHDTHRVPDGWKYNKEHGVEPGGSKDVIVAVIDTGVDYTHLDLRNNIWRNSAEIPDNGIDDDGNGYVDDVYGWNFVADNNNPMDDNGHGTHVAGIIAAENNGIGGVGVAFNSKIMVLKAGNSSGYFNNSDIAEAIQYAYMNGASVINMSFGGSLISLAVEDALENAYNSCVLVAAAGNDGACNNLSCEDPNCLIRSVSYPAALPYVIGVMSTNSDGTVVSSFSNYDHYPYNSIEYEVYAVGESVFSTWPNNKYAVLNGTSMATPYVSGIAALLRTAYPDRNTYSTKYLQSQIVNTGSVNPIRKLTVDEDHSVANVYEALTKLPTPEVNLYDYKIDDSVSLSDKNDGNGVVNAGERIRLYLSLYNRGGVASNVNVSIDTIRDNDPSLTDPYFTIVNSMVNLSDIGTYSEREANAEQYFEILVDENCPNDYLANINVKFNYTNGMDSSDTKIYTDKGTEAVQFNVSRGWYLPKNITEDTTFTADRLYILGEDMVIAESVTVTFEEGCQIQFYDDREYYNSPRIINYGTLNFNGNKEKMIKIAPNQMHLKFVCYMQNYGTLTVDYAETKNILFIKTIDSAEIRVSNSHVLTEGTINGAEAYNQGFITNATKNRDTPASYINNYFYISAGGFHICSKELDGNFFVFDGFATVYTIGGVIKNNVFISNEMKTVTSMNVDIPCHLEETAYIENNQFIADSVEDLLSFDFESAGSSSSTIVSNNTFSPIYQQYAAQVIDGYYDATGKPTIDVYGQCSDISLLYPYVHKVQLFNKNGEEVTTIGKEEVTVRITFNRAMDKTQNTYATFGTREPYADYRVGGEFISDTVWEGKYTLTAQIENGLQYLRVWDAYQADDITKQVIGKYQLHKFNIDTTAAMAMNLQAVETEDGIELTWQQDDYYTLLGYNIYRSEDKNGKYVKLNPTILLSTDSVFIDENAEPGKTYWYTYTVVLSDFTESNPAGRVQCTAMDTIKPTVYHTPVNQGYQNNNLVIYCTASDNVAIAKVTLYYRTYGETAYKALIMVKINDKYSATVFGSELTLAGLEYYIVASDGRNEIEKGNAAAPYYVVVKDASSISRLGDVDGDGVVSTKDALMLMQCINGDLILSDDEFKRADLNGDGVLSSVEALRILQYVNGKITSLEM